MSTNLNSLNKDFNLNRQHTDSKIEEVAEKGRGRNEKIAEVKKEIEEVKEQILKARQRNATNHAPRKAMKDANEKPAFDNDLIEELDQEVRLQSEELTKLQQQVAELQKNQG